MLIPGKVLLNVFLKGLASIEQDTKYLFIFFQLLQQTEVPLASYTSYRIPMTYSRKNELEIQAVEKTS